MQAQRKSSRNSPRTFRFMDTTPQKDNSNRYTRGFLNTYLYFGAVHNRYTIVPIAALDGKFCRGSQPALCLPTF